MCTYVDTLVVGLVLYLIQVGESSEIVNGRLSYDAGEWNLGD